MLAIVVSRADDASTHVGDHLRELADWTVTHDGDRSDAAGGGDVWRLADAELRAFERRHLDLDGVADAFDDPDLLVFASKHAGKTGRLLTAHHTGNFGPAEFGGEDRAFARACPAAHKRVIEALSRHTPDDYDVGMECTHHGPTDVGVPSMFVEVGSAQDQWDDPAAARAVARAILDLRGVDPDMPREDGTRRHLVGFGGGHYVPRFERIVRETDWAVGHIGSDWCLDDLGDPETHRDVIRAAFEGSAADYAVIADDRPALQSVVEDLGYRVVGETFVRETTGVELDLVERVEAALGPVEPTPESVEPTPESAQLTPESAESTDESAESGTRFGTLAADFDGEFVVTDLPDALRTEALGIDQEAALAAVADRAVAFRTTESGTRVGDRLALGSVEDRTAIVEALADVLARKYDSVERTEDAVVVTETAFDPEKARTLGIPEGPAFGKLSAGQSVEVGGRTIEPDVVHEERTRRFPY